MNPEIAHSAFILHHSSFESLALPSDLFHAPRDRVRDRAVCATAPRHARARECEGHCRGAGHDVVDGNDAAACRDDDVGACETEDEDDDNDNSGCGADGSQAETDEAADLACTECLCAAASIGSHAPVCADRQRTDAIQTSAADARFNKLRPTKFGAIPEQFTKTI